MPADVSAISQILHRYCHAADRRDIDEIVSLFARDGAVIIRGVAHAGHDALVTLYQAWAESQPDGAVQRHHVTSPLITITEDTATSVSYMRAESVLPDGTWTVDVGHYDDVLERSPEGRWILRRRELGIEAHLASDQPAVIAHVKWDR